MVLQKNVKNILWQKNIKQLEEFDGDSKQIMVDVISWLIMNIILLKQLHTPWKGDTWAKELLLGNKWWTGKLKIEETN